jgi:hypothetical protein
LRGDGCDQHCVASQAVRRPDEWFLIIAEKPANGGLLQSADRLQTPDLTGYGAQSTKVSGDSLKYPFFERWRLETGFDLHCVVELAVECSNSPPEAGQLESPTHTAAPASRYKTSQILGSAADGTLNNGGKPRPVSADVN